MERNLRPRIPYSVADGHAASMAANAAPGQDKNFGSV